MSLCNIAAANRQRWVRPLLCASLLMLSSLPAWADQIHVAVASNFTEAAKQLVANFEAASDHRVILSFGSTGKHYAQIKNGAPFDLFLAADSKRPQLLEQQGVAQTGSRFTYAIGRLVLWSPRADFIDPELTVLDQLRFRHLAIANPKLAPYGKAAQQVLEGRGLWSKLGKKMVRGENIGQAYQFVRSGNAELGFVAAAQVMQPNKPQEGSLWDIPPSLYSPIEQQAVLLKNNQPAREFLSFIKSKESLTLIRRFGYGTP